jgi:hypothetical protein
MKREATISTLSYAELGKFSESLFFLILSNNLKPIFIFKRLYFILYFLSSLFFISKPTLGKSKTLATKFETTLFLSERAFTSQKTTLFLNECTAISTYSGFHFDFLAKFSSGTMLTRCETSCTALTHIVFLKKRRESTSYTTINAFSRTMLTSYNTINARLPTVQ